MENWQAIPGYPGYEVSDLGRIRSMDREIICSNGVRKHYKGRTLKPVTDGTGYQNVVLCSADSQKVTRIHRLVLSVFVGAPAEGEEACHNNGNKTDNRLSNLRWDTRSGNFSDKYRHGTHNQGERHSVAKLKDQDAYWIYRLCVHGLSQRSVAEHFSVSEATVSNIVKGKSWKHIDRRAA